MALKKKGTVQLVDLKRQYLPYIDSIRSEMEEVIASSSFILGSKVSLLEERLSGFTGVKHAVGVSSGTDALTLSLMALGVEPGDVVVTPTFTFIAAVESILLLGAVPLFIDIDRDTFTIDSRKLEGVFQRKKKEGTLSKVKAVIAVSLYGQPCDMDDINRISEDAGVAVIEDACQSFGASYKNQKSGSLAPIGITSFFPTKPFGCFGDGGMIFCNDNSFFKRVTILRDHGQSAKYVHEFVGMNGRLDALQAAVLHAKFPHFEKEIALREEKAALYSDRLGNSVSTPVIRRDRKSAWALYTIRVKNRASVIKRLSEAGVQTAIHYPVPIHMQPVLGKFGYKEGDFPESEKASREVLSLPFHPHISRSEQDCVIENLLTALSLNGEA